MLNRLNGEKVIHMKITIDVSCRGLAIKREGREVVDE